MPFKIHRRSTAPKISKSGAIKVKAPTIARTDLKSSIRRLQSAMQQVREVVLQRDEEVTALTLCILTGQHMMLEGPHGIAKSMLAREVTRRITGSVLFEKQLMKGTQTDEVFGPMNSKRYREDAVWEHNIDGYLPSADFAFLDEVYRGSDSLLGSLMGLLNERTFHNGNIVVKCPLITAIGTTNFVTDTDELLAFHDRWLVTSKLKPLSEPRLRRKMLTDFHKRLIAQEESGKDPEELLTVPISDIHNIRAHLSEVDVSTEIMELFDQLLREVVRGIGGRFYLSDRRACLTLNTVLMQSLLDIENKGGELKPEHLSVAEYGIVAINDAAGKSAFDTAYERVVGTYERNAEEIAAAKLTLQRSKKMCSMYDKGLIRPHLKKLYIRVNQLYDAISGMEGDEAPTLDSTKEMYAECLNDLKAVMLEMEELPKLSEVVRDYKAKKVDDMAEQENAAKQKPNAFAPEDKESGPVDSEGNAIPEFATLPLNVEDEGDEDDQSEGLKRLFKKKPIVLNKKAP